jgi:GRF zinc finger
MLEITQTSEQVPAEMTPKPPAGALVPREQQGQQHHQQQQQGQQHHHQQQQQQQQRSLQQTRPGASSGGLEAMRALAAKRSVAGVFVAGGHWTGRCLCLVGARLRVTKRPGPNHGRGFFSCGRWTITRQASRGCDFFLWQDDVVSRR